MTENIDETNSGAGAASRTAAEPGKMYEYYRGQTVAPTFGNLRDLSALERFGEHRVDLYVNKLSLPLRLFKGAEVLEFGPDTGEHALIFARWGAEMTLVEPNPDAARQIKEYFKRFRLEDSLKAIFETDIAGFASDQRFDLIDAEGFIYTLQPASEWLRTFHRLLKDDGLTVVSYYSRLGGFMDLCLKAFYLATRDLTGQSTTETALMLYETKWNSISHNRPFESWVMDMHENPYVRASYFLDPLTLCQQAVEQGFELYSSWPAYRDPLQVYWHKRVLPEDRRMESVPDHLARSCLSQFTGRKMYLTPDMGQVMQVNNLLNALVVQMDSLIDSRDDAVLSRCAELLRELAAMIPSLPMITDHPDTGSMVVSLLSKLEGAIRLIGDGKVDDLVCFTNTDRDFIDAWGLPVHFSVFRKARD